MRHNVRDEKGRFKRSEPVTGYKMLNYDWTCRGKKYQIGETYEEFGRRMCNEGMMHFCESPMDILDYYPLYDSMGRENVIVLVEAIGRVIRDGNKSATNKLRIIRQLSFNELINWQFAKEDPNSRTVYTTKGIAVCAPCNALSNRIVTIGNYSTAVYNDRRGRYGQAYTTGDRSVAVGEAAAVVTGSESVAISTYAVAASNKSIAISKLSEFNRQPLAMACKRDSIAISAPGRDASGVLGSWLLLISSDFKCVKLVQVNNMDIKEGNRYYLSDSGKIREITC